MTTIAALTDMTIRFWHCTIFHSISLKVSLIILLMPIAKIVKNKKIKMPTMASMAVSNVEMVYKTEDSR